MQGSGARGQLHSRYRRTGTLWEERFKAALVDSERYLMACYRHIELNPVRAGMTTDPADYRWSSHSHNASGREHPLITPHQDYLRLGSAPAARRAACCSLICEHLDEPQLAELRLHTRQQRLEQRLIP